MFLLWAFVLAETEYAVLVDAGPSSTDTYVYEYDSTTILPQPKQIGVNSVSGVFLHAAVYDESVIGAICDGAINYANTLVPANKAPTARFYVIGTSGMRKISTEEQAAIYNKTLDYVQKNSKYLASSERFETLRKSDEALYSWVSVNSALGNFHLNDSAVPVMGLSGGNSWVIIPSTDAKYKNNLYPLEIAGITFKFYTHVFDRLGLTDAQLNHTFEIARKESRAVIKSPCFPLGYTNDSPIEVTGEGNYLRCKGVLSNLTFLLEDDKVPPEYTLNGVPIPPITDPIYAIGSYTIPYIYTESEATIGQYDEKGAEFCSMTLDEMKEKYKEYNIDKYLETDCFQFAYQTTFLPKAFGFNDNTKIKRVSTIGDYKIGWQHGAVIAEALPPPEPEADMTKLIAAGATVAILVFIILIIVIVLVVRKNIKAKKEMEEKEFAAMNAEVVDDEIFNIMPQGRPV